jgi:hypothetical protein
MMKNLESSATSNLSALSINRREFLIGSGGLLLMAGTFGAPAVGRSDFRAAMKSKTISKRLYVLSLK